MPLPPPPPAPSAARCSSSACRRASSSAEPIERTTAFGSSFKPALSGTSSAADTRGGSARLASPALPPNPLPIINPSQIPPALPRRGGPLPSGCDCMASDPTAQLSPPRSSVAGRGAAIAPAGAPSMVGMVGHVPRAGAIVCADAASCPGPPGPACSSASLSSACRSAYCDNCGARAACAGKGFGRPSASSKPSVRAVSSRPCCGGTFAFASANMTVPSGPCSSDSASHAACSGWPV